MRIPRSILVHDLRTIEIKTSIYETDSFETDKEDELFYRTEFSHRCHCWEYEQAKFSASRNPPKKAPDRMRTNDLL